MKKNAYGVLRVSSLVFALSGCHGGQDNSEVNAPPTPVTENVAPTLMVGEVNNPQSADVKNQVTKAIQDLTGRLDAPSDEIKLIRAENVTWRDGSLGCPKKGMFYTQALVPGTLILLSSGDAEYEYHSGSGRDPFFCANPQLPLPVKTAE